MCETSSRFHERLDRSIYAEEEPVGFAVGERDLRTTDLPEDRWILVPESLADRMVH